MSPAVAAPQQRPPRGRLGPVRPLAGAPVVRRVMAAVYVPEFRAPAADAMLAMLQAVAAEQRV